MTVYLINKNNEKFTFPQGFIDSIKVNFETGVEQLKMPISGPMNNQGIDIDGCAKTITISGQFFDTESSVTTINDTVVNNIRSKKIMKYWFEAILSGFQRTLIFYAPNDEFSAISENPATVMFDEVSGTNVTIRARFVPTKVYLTNFSPDTNAGDLERIPFTITLWVAGI
jgi:hypothetical protein